MKRSFYWGPGALNVLLEADKNSGGEGGEAATPADAAKTEVSEVKDLPEFARKLIEDLRKENAAARTAKTQLEKAREEAEAKRLADEKKWEELAAQRAAKLAELEPQAASLSEKIATYEATFKKQLETEIKDWPAELKALDPGDGADLSTRLSWLEKSRPLAKKLMESTTTNNKTNAGTGRLPRNGAGTGQASATENQQQWAGGIQIQL